MNNKEDHPKSIEDEEKLHQKIREKAYYLWLENQQDHSESYWLKARQEILQEEKRKSDWVKMPILYKWYLHIEKNKLEPWLKWLEDQALFKIAGIIGSLTIFTGLIIFIAGEGERHKITVKNNWDFITDEDFSKINFAMVDSAEKLNSPPLKFPWLIGYTNYEEIKWTENLGIIDFMARQGKTCTRGIRFIGQILLGSRRERQKFNFIDLSNRKLASARLCNASFQQAILKDTDLSRSKLNGSFFFDADLIRANLSNSILQEVDFTQANLADANLSGSDLNDANLTGTNLSGTYLYQTKKTNNQLKQACNWEKVIYTQASWDTITRKWIPDDESKLKKIIANIRRDTRSNPNEFPKCDKFK